jgi:hypothetical protein
MARRRQETGDGKTVGDWPKARTGLLNEKHKETTALLFRLLALPTLAQNKTAPTVAAAASGLTGSNSGEAGRACDSKQSRN